MNLPIDDGNESYQAYCDRIAHENEQEQLFLLNADAANWTAKDWAEYHEDINDEKEQYEAEEASDASFRRKYPKE